MTTIKIIINFFSAFVGNGIFPLLAAIALASGIVGFMSPLPFFHIVVFLFAFIFIAKGTKRFKSSVILLLLYIPCAIALAQPDSVFQSWSRYAIFIMVMALASPLIENLRYAQFRQKTLLGFLSLVTVMSLISFCCYFTGINMMTIVDSENSLGIDVYQSRGGVFGGLFQHSIVLGWACGLSILYCLFLALNNKRQSKHFWLLIFILFITMLFSASRSAILATFGATCVMLLKGGARKGVLIKTVFAVSIIGSLTFPFWESALSGIQHKSEANGGNLMEARADKWNCRTEEFLSSPIYGIGFASVDPKGNDEYNPINGQIEPGNSWLAILAQIGAVGFVLILLIILPVMKSLWHHTSVYNALLLGLCVFFCLHFMAEGYGLAGGGVLCFVAWLVFGCGNDARRFDMNNNSITRYR